VQCAIIFVHPPSKTGATYIFMLPLDDAMFTVVIRERNFAQEAGIKPELCCAHYTL